jgi:metabolite-proton symporter
MNESIVARPTLSKVVAGSLIGTTIEWYDFFLYGTAAALVFNRLFFPEYSPLTGTLLAFASYALGFVARPLGGIVFGHFGDLIGRKRLLMLSLVFMGGSTCAIGLLPTYAEIGMLAPILLVVLRLIQGFAVGGEWGGAVLLVSEHSEAKSRGFWASWPQVGVPAGNVLAAAVLAIMSAVQNEANFMAWGWRIPFLLSVVLVAVGWWVRASVSESALFEGAQTQEATIKAVAFPVAAVLRDKPGALGIGAGLRLGENISYYILTTFSITFLTQISKEGRSVVLTALVAGAVAECIAIPLFALLSDNIGRRAVYAFGAVGLAVWVFVFFALLETGNRSFIFLAVIPGMILHGAMYGPQAAFIAELFPTKIRYSGASLAYHFTSIFAGSLAPIIAIALYQKSHSITPVAVYVAIACLISCATALASRETRGIDLSNVR